MKTPKAPVRRSARIQQRAGNTASSPVLQELLPVKRSSRKNPRVVRRRKTVLKTGDASRRPIEHSDPAHASVPLIPSAQPVVDTATKARDLSTWLQAIYPTFDQSPPESFNTLAAAVAKSSAKGLSRGSSDPSESTFEMEASSPFPKTAPRVRITPMIFKKMLGTRLAYPRESTKDANKEHIMSVFGLSSPLIATFEDTEMLEKSCAKFIEYKKSFSEESTVNAQTVSAREVKHLVEEWTDELHKWRATLKLATLTDTEFNCDLEHCKDDESNEAMLQRTILPAILNRHQLNKMFVFNFEMQWLPPGPNALPSYDPEDGGLPPPKPGLAIFFNRDSLGKLWDPIPNDLERSLRPGGPGSHCFPFLIIEAKKQSEQLTSALDKSMYSANLALFNIHKCMEAAGKLDDFFDKVRTFTIAINADCLIARMHRAETSSGPVTLRYEVCELAKIHDFTGEQASNLVRSILEYGAGKMHSTLGKTFKILSSKVTKAIVSDELDSNKRKNDDVDPVVTTKKPRASHNAAESSGRSTAHSRTSFSASRINIDDDLV